MAGSVSVGGRRRSETELISRRRADNPTPRGSYVIVGIDTVTPNELRGDSANMRIEP